MLRCCLFVLIAGVLSSLGVSPGQEPSGFSEPDRLAIDQMLDRYSQAYVTKDYATIREYVQAPFVTFPGEPKIFESMDAVMNRYRNEREPLDQRGYDHGQYLQTRITALAADRALVNKVFRRYKKDGSLLEDVATVYLVSKSSGTWRVYGSLAQDLKYFGKIY